MGEGMTGPSWQDILDATQARRGPKMEQAGGTALRDQIAEAIYTAPFLVNGYKVRRVWEHILDDELPNVYAAADAVLAIVPAAAVPSAEVLASWTRLSGSLDRRDDLSDAMLADQDRIAEFFAAQAGEG